MALSGIQIYKLLPQTNCKDCDFPTCLAFAMKLAAKQAELAACPHVSEESKAKLEESAAPPVRLVTLSANGREAKAGNETVMFRHEKTFYNPPGIFVRLRDDLPLDELKAKAQEIADYVVDYVGMELTVDGFAVEATGDGATFAKAIETVLEVATRPLVLIAEAPAVMAKGLEAAADATPLLYGATPENWPIWPRRAKPPWRFGRTRLARWPSSPQRSRKQAYRTLFSTTGCATWLRRWRCRPSCAAWR
jgi:acetyl-CoA decarbonylase/synthase complex subunit gamma